MSTPYGPEKCPNCGEDREHVCFAGSEPGLITKKLDAIHLALTEHLARCENCRKDVADHDLILNGAPENGDHPGLKLRVASVEKSLEETRSQNRWSLRALWAAILSGIAALVFGKH